MPTLDQVRSVLTKHGALLVHFDTNMKDTNPAFGTTDFPCNLYRCCLQPRIRIAACTVFADSTIANLPVGNIGVILDPINGDSIKSVLASEQDSGSMLLDGERVGYGHCPTVDNMETHVRPKGGYTEWLIENFNVIGVFLFDRDDLHAWIAKVGVGQREEVWPQPNIASVIKSFPQRRIFTIQDGQFQQLDLTTHKLTIVTHGDIYGWT